MKQRRRQIREAIFLALTILILTGGQAIAHTVGAMEYAFIVSMILIIGMYNAKRLKDED